MSAQRLILCLFLALPIAVQAGDLKPFKSDGCSAFPDGTLAEKQLWLSCCVAHDFAYWQGGSYEERKLADVELKHCVEQVGKPAIAKLMLAGVRVGGSPYWPTQFRWGYGWPYPRGYQALTADEKKLIEDSLKNTPADLPLAGQEDGAKR